MRVPVPARRKPTLLERVLGRRRVRQLRRQFGYLALGASYKLLKPRNRLVPLAGSVGVLALVVALRTRV
jgi:hypothetical protein